jgi:membrane dipeptidase
MRGRITVALIISTLTGCTAVPRAATDADPALQLHRAAIVIDTHSDTTPWFRDPDFAFDERHSEGHMDLPRMREGGLDAQFWVIYMGKREGDGRAIREALQRIDAIYEMVRRYSDQTELARSAADVRRIVAAGKIASLMGVEGGHIIEEDLAALRTYYRLGVRYMSLTHSFHIGWADSSGVGQPLEPLHGGLTEFGEQVVREMNRLGMMVDVSHVSDESFEDVIRVSQAPVIASHSSARAVADHPRNLSDEMLRALADNGGVAMINFYPAYIDLEANARARQHSAELEPRTQEIRERYGDDLLGRMRANRALRREHPWPQTSMDVLLNHFDHAIAVAGPEHVGVGADWDGVPSMPAGMEDVSKLPALTRGLLELGHSPETVRKVLGENLLRVMAEVEEVAGRLRGSPR